MRNGHVASTKRIRLKKPSANQLKEITEMHELYLKLDKGLCSFSHSALLRFQYKFNHRKLTEFVLALSKSNDIFRFGV